MSKINLTPFLHTFSHLSSQSSHAPRTVGIVAVITDQVLMLAGDVVYDQPQPL